MRIRAVYMQPQEASGKSWHKIQHNKLVVSCKQLGSKASP